MSGAAREAVGWVLFAQDDSTKLSWPAWRLQHGDRVDAVITKYEESLTLDDLRRLAGKFGMWLAPDKLSDEHLIAAYRHDHSTGAREDNLFRAVWAALRAAAKGGDDDG